MLLLLLFLIVLQVGLALHTRTVLVSAAQEGARYGANADRGPDQAAQRARSVVAEALSPGVAASLDAVSSRRVVIGGVPTIEVTLSGPLPLVLVPAGPLRITVSGHALDESALS